MSSHEEDINKLLMEIASLKTLIRMITGKEVVDEDGVFRLEDGDTTHLVRYDDCESEPEAKYQEIRSIVREVFFSSFSH